MRLTTAELQRRGYYPQGYFNTKAQAQTFVKFLRTQTKKFRRPIREYKINQSLINNRYGVWSRKKK